MAAATQGRFSTGMLKRERRRTVADDLYKKLVEERESFWTVVYPLYMQREITRGNVRDLVHKGLEEARGNYKIVLRLFNMEARDYKRFLNFLAAHDCNVDFRAFRNGTAPTGPMRAPRLLPPLPDNRVTPSAHGSDHSDESDTTRRSF